MFNRATAGNRGSWTITAILFSYLGSRGLMDKYHCLGPRLYFKLKTVPTSNFNLPQATLAQSDPRATLSAVKSCMQLYLTFCL